MLVTAVFKWTNNVFCGGSFIIKGLKITWFVLLDNN